MDKIVLVIAAHPDDEILGCGGTIARFAKQGCEIFTMILGEGITSRDTKRSGVKRKKELNELKQQVIYANNIIGAKEVFIHGLADNRFDTVPFLDVVKLIEKVKKDVHPDIIFTHYEKDLNIDHQITYKAAITAARPIGEHFAKEIYSFEILSSTEWNWPNTFSPDVFFDISSTIALKMKAMEQYKSEIRQFPHPRSILGIKVLSEYRGMQAGIQHVEAFKCVRIIR